MSDTPIDVFLDLPSSPGPVQAGRLWSHFHHVHVTHSQIAKKITCRPPGPASLGGLWLIMQAPELAFRPGQALLRREVAPRAQRELYRDATSEIRRSPHLSQQTRQLLLTLPC